MVAVRHYARRDNVRGEEVTIELVDETQLHDQSCFPTR